MSLSLFFPETFALSFIYTMINNAYILCFYIRTRYKELENCFCIFKATLTVNIFVVVVLNIYKRFYVKFLSFSRKFSFSIERKRKTFR